MPDVIETDASSSFVCDYVAGINRVLSLPPYLLVDNIGRNFELWRFRPGDREPAERTICDFTVYPDDPMAALLDLDIHAAFLRRAGRELVTINHYGRVRAFDLPASTSRIRPVWECQLLGDTERVVMAGDCFIASSPRGEFTEDPAQPGLFLFEPIPHASGSASGEPRRLACEQALESWGVATAVAVPARGHRLAVAAEGRLGVFDLAASVAGLRFGACAWEAPLAFECQWLHYDDADLLWAGGAGTVQCFSAGDGACEVTIPLPEEAAWGYGADPVVLSADGRKLYVLGRDASLHVIRGRALPGESQARPRVASLGESQTRPRSDLGIGHMAMRDGWLYAGFSRGGFQLLRYDLR